MVFDDMLVSSNSRYRDQFFFRGLHNNLDFYNLPQSYFNLPKITIRNKIILFIKLLKDIGNINRVVDGYDVSYDELKELRRRAWEEDYNYLSIDRSKKRDQGRYCIFNENKNTYSECTSQTKDFLIVINVVSN